MLTRDRCTKRFIRPNIVEGSSGVMSGVRLSIFRPCIDLHDGFVKQIVGGSLSDKTPNDLKTNFVAKSAELSFASRMLGRYQRLLDIQLILIYLL